MSATFDFERQLQECDESELVFHLLACARKFRNRRHLVSVAKETAKAVAAEIVIRRAEREERRLVWFAKSTIDCADGWALIRGWLIRMKVQKALAALSGGEDRFGNRERAYLVRGIKLIDPDSDGRTSGL